MNITSNANFLITGNFCDAGNPFIEAMADFEKIASVAHECNQCDLANSITFATIKATRAFTDLLSLALGDAIGAMLLKRELSRCEELLESYQQASANVERKGK